MKLQGSSVRKFFFVSVPQCWQRLIQSRSVAKISKFYFVFSVLLTVEVFYCIKLRHDLLDPSENSPFFDFVSTSVEQTSLSRASCATAAGFHPFKWRGLGPWLSNYLFFPRLINWVAWVLGVAAALSFLLAFATRHFQYIPRARYARPAVPQLLFGVACKQLPWLIRLLFLSAVSLGVFTLVLIHGFHACDNRLPDIGAPMAKIRNCRLWVRKCANDMDPFGSHLECASRDNFSAFSRFPCDAQDGECAFMKGDTAVPVEFGICGGEDIPLEMGGPLPRCPLCQAHRKERHMNGLFRGRSLIERSENYSSENLSFNKRLHEHGSTRSHSHDTSSGRPRSALSRAFTNDWNEFGSSSSGTSRETEDGALAAAYLQTLRFYSQGSHLSLALDYWALTLALIAVGYILVEHLGFTTSSEGYFRCTQSLFLSSKYVSSF